MEKKSKKNQSTKEQIINAAKELFMQNDYQKTTMQNIMEKVKIAKGTIYHYFKSKEEILEAVVKQIADEYLIKIKKKIPKISGSPIEKLHALVIASNVSNEKDEFFKKLHRPGNVNMHSYLLAIITNKLAPLYADIIEEGIKEGIFKVSCPLEAAELLIGGIQFITDIGIYPWDQKDLLRRNKAIPSLFENLLNAPEGSFQDIKK